MALPQLRPDGLLHRTAKKLWIQDGIVSSLAFVRRPPSTDKNGNRQDGDATGLSVGFAENEDLQSFIDRTRHFLSFQGVIGVGIGKVQELGLRVEPFQESEVKGNIIGMPYDKETPEMNDEQRAEIDEKRAVELQEKLAQPDTSSILITGQFPKIERLR